jgi:signal transduction histidine kinase
VVEAAAVMHSLFIATNPRASALGLAVAMYTVGAQEPRSRSLPAALAVAAVNAAVCLGLFVAGQSEAPTSLFEATVLVAGSWALGDNIGTRRAYLASLEERASRLEREQQERSDRAVLDERSRIARELHDVVAHHVSAIAVQAGAAEEIAENDPRRARQVLGSSSRRSSPAATASRATAGRSASAWPWWRSRQSRQALCSGCGTCRSRGWRRPRPAA